MPSWLPPEGCQNNKPSNDRALAAFAAAFLAGLAAK